MCVVGLSLADGSRSFDTSFWFVLAVRGQHARLREHPRLGSGHEWSARAIIDGLPRVRAYIDAGVRAADARKEGARASVSRSAAKVIVIVVVIIMIKVIIIIIVIVIVIVIIK